MAFGLLALGAGQAAAAPVITYRAVPILPGQITPAQLQTAMDTMYPRPVRGS